MENIVLRIKFISLVLVPLLNIIKVFHRICESQIKNWDCKYLSRNLNLLHLMINLFSINWFKYLTKLNGSTKLFVET